MLNDNIRNSSFREAIIKKVKQGFNSVLDIGTGTGILSLFAVEAGAQEIYACEVSKTMTEIAETVLMKNKVGEKVKLINKLSNDITIPCDIPHRVSLVISETVDIGLLGENILQTLIHAWDNLLLPLSSNEHYSCSAQQMTGCVIPYMAHVWVAAIESNYIASKYRTFEDECEGGKQESGGYSCYNFLKLNLFALDDQEYDSLNLDKVPQGFRFLTAPVIGLKVNFNDCKNMQELVNGTHDNQIIEALCCDKGRVDAFVVWFDLYLHEDIAISSVPKDVLNRAKCWDQAVFPLQKPHRVLENDKLKFSVNCVGGKLSIKFHSCLSTSVMKRDEEIIVTENECCSSEIHVDSKKLTYDTVEKMCYQMSPEIISYLNDTNWITAVNGALQSFLLSLKFTSCLTILDLSPFPLLNMSILSKKISLEVPSYILTCLAKDEEEKLKLTSLAHYCNIEESQLHILVGELEEVVDANQKFDLILYHPVDACGKLNEKYITYLPFLSMMTTPTGDLLPKEIKICCQIIHSHELKEVSEVIDKRMSKYSIASVINKYKVSEHLDVTFATLDYNCYSNVIETPSISSELLISSNKKPLVFTMFTHVINNGEINAIPYWFKINLWRDYEVSSFSNTSFCNQAVVLLETPLNVTIGERVCVNIICHEGLIHATICKES